MRSRTNADANAEASPARVSSVNPIDSPRDRTVVVWVSLGKTVLVADSRVSLAKIVLVPEGILGLFSSGSDSKGHFETWSGFQTLFKLHIYPHVTWAFKADLLTNRSLIVSG